MKKVLSILMAFIIFPINILAYSEYIIPGGENIGININTDGLIVVGFYKVNNEYIAKNTLKIGDIILEIEGEDIASIDEMADLIDEKIINNKVNIKIKRNNKELNTTLTLVKENGTYKTGLYIKEKVTGIGTLTYIDPKTNIYGALGHEIALSETNKRVEIKGGNIYESFVNSIDKSREGIIGSKSAKINYGNILGTIKKNTEYGLFGSFSSVLPLKSTMKVSDFEDIELGKAYIYTITDGNIVKSYEIEIKEKNKQKIKSTKSISFEITDDELLSIAGGVVQGMSGSPIIQNNKIIGAVTHVVVDDPKKGYGIFIRTMLENGEN